MAKLYFRYGCMNSGKSLDLLRIAHNYNELEEKVLLFTPSIDNRYGQNKIKSRTNIEMYAISINDKDNIYNMFINENSKQKIQCVLVDEVQFLNKKQIFEIVDIVDILNVPVICYGLRNSFNMEPFEGSKYLMAIADSIEEIKTICAICKSKKAIVNARFENGKLVKNGEQVKIGGNESYKPLCRKCFKKLNEK
jgi:thymidine kinase